MPCLLLRLSMATFLMRAVDGMDGVEPTAAAATCGAGDGQGDCGPALLQHKHSKLQRSVTQDDEAATAADINTVSGDDCKRWCLTKDKTWEEKCSWKDGKNCGGCIECVDPSTATTGCAASCATDPLKWETHKCKWIACESCAPCLMGPTPEPTRSPTSAPTEQPTPMPPDQAQPPQDFGPIAPFTMLPSTSANANDTIDLQGETTDAAVTVLSGCPYMALLRLSGAGGGGTPDFVFEASAPAGLQINRRSGTITWQPDVSQSGVYSAVVVVNGTGAANAPRLQLQLTVVATASNPPGIYVWHAGGSDENDGSVASPFATVAHAATVANPGDTIYIRGGTYFVEQEEIWVEATPELPVLITRLPGEHVRLIGEKKRDIFIIRPGSHGMIFRGLELDGNAYNDHWAVLRKSWWRVDHQVVGAMKAFQIEGEHVTVEECHIHHFNQKAVEIRSTGRYVTVRYNLIHSIGYASLSGGAGIHRQWLQRFQDPDDARFFRWDIYGNMVLGVEQRIYSFIPWKKYCFLELDEGKPINVDASKDHEVKTRIAQNLVLYGGVAHIRILFNRNLQVYNNAVMSSPGRNKSDGITTKGNKDSDKKCYDTACTIGGVNPNMTFFNNLVHANAENFAFSLVDQFSAVDNPSRVAHNYYSGGKSRPTTPGINEHAESVFRDPASRDFQQCDRLPPGVGVDPAIIEHLMAMIEEYAIDFGPMNWQHDHCKNLETIMDSYPRDHLELKGLGDSKKKKDHRAYWFNVKSEFYKDLCKCTSLELILTDYMVEHCLS